MRTSMLIVGCSLAMVLSAQDSTTVAGTWAGSIAAYEQGDHQRALDGFLALAGDQQSATLEFNIGNCYYKLQDVPRAVLHFERAALLAPGDDDIRANLDLARTLIVDRMNEPPGSTLGSTWERFRGGTGPDQWAIVALWTCALLFAALMLYVLTDARWLRRIALVSALVALVGLTGAMLLAGQRHAELTAHDQAIIMSPKVDVTSEPKAGGTLLFVLHEGTKVKVLEQRGEWCSVRVLGGTVGWVRLKDLERI